MSSASRPRNYVDVLGGLSLFKGSPRPELAPLARRAVPMRFASRRTIFTQGEVCSALYVLLEGGVKLERREGAGPGQVLGILEPVTMFGEVGLLSENGQPVSAITFRPSEVLALDAGEFMAWVRARPGTYDSVLEQLGRDLEEIISTSYARATLSAEQRVAAYLLDRDRQTPSRGIAVDRAISRRDIANLLGIAPETLSRVLHGFRERRYIAVRDGCIAVRSGSSLSAMLP